MAHLRGLAFLILFCGASPAYSEAEHPPPPGVLVDIGGRHIHLYCTGSGTSTIVIVGGGFSVDWYLVQEGVARFARVCTYDPSGTAWSDPFLRAGSARSNEGRTPTCLERIEELHQVLLAAAVKSPYVLVGYSIGGLYARLYASRYLQDINGMVIVDHAYIPPENNPVTSAPSADRNGSRPSGGRGILSVSEADSPPVLIESVPIVVGLEDDVNFNRLPKRIRDLHRWAMSLNPVRPNVGTAAECRVAVESTTTRHSAPLKQIPLVVISTNNDSPGYAELQSELLSLSQNSVKRVALGSSHMVMVDAPEVIVRAIHDVITAAQNRSRLTQ